MSAVSYAGPYWRMPSFTSSMVTFFNCVSQLDCPLSMFSLFNVVTHTTSDPTFANIAELAEHQGLQEKQRKSKQGHAKQLFLWQQPAKQIRAMPCTDFLYILIELWSDPNSMGHKSSAVPNVMLILASNIARKRLKSKHHMTSCKPY